MTYRKAEHGTSAGYYRLHLARGEPPCEQCREARRAYAREHRRDPDKKKAADARYYAAHRDEVNEQMRERRAPGGRYYEREHARSKTRAETAEERERVARHYRAAEAETREQATRSGAPWSADELAIAVRDDLTVKAAALMLGRTYSSVRAMRSIARRSQSPAEQRALDEDAMDLPEEAGDLAAEAQESA